MPKGFFRARVIVVFRALVFSQQASNAEMVVLLLTKVRLAGTRFHNGYAKNELFGDLIFCFQGGRKRLMLQYIIVLPGARGQRAKA